MSVSSPSAGGGGISVVVNARDEERHLPYALRSVLPWADEVVVVDMVSRDRTAEIARGLGARVFSHADVGCVEPARAFAIGRATRPWVLVLDADELVPVALSRTLRAIARENAVDLVRIPRVNHLLGGPLLHTGWNPGRDLQARFFRPEAVEMPTRIHQPFRPVPGARTRDLGYRPGEALVHFNYLDVDQFVARLARYTTVEAEHAIARGEHSSPRRALGGALREWSTRYLWHGGFRDGWRGFYLALLMAFYRVTVEAKMASRERLGPAASVDAAYRGEAERLIEGYGGSATGPTAAAEPEAR